MRHKYTARKKYSKIDPIDYTLQRFTSPAGKIIDEIEKKSVLDLLVNSGIDRKKKLRILDVATGPGRLAFYLEHYFKKSEIIGMDINDNMLKRARKIADNNKSNIKFISGDVYNLPFKDGEFDVITGLRFSMHLPQIDRVIKELSRVLKGDGVLIFDIFNYNSILRLKLLKGDNKVGSGYYTIKEINNFAKNCKLKLLEYRGVLFFGETLLRKFFSNLLFLFSPFVSPPKSLEKLSTKLILCFKNSSIED